MKPYSAYKPSGVPWLGSVPESWKQMRLRDAVEGCLNGIWGEEPDGTGNDTPVVRVADFDRQARLAKDHPTIRSIPRDQRNGRELIFGDLLIEKSGGGDLQPVGMVVQYRGETGAVSSNFVARMRPRDGVHSRFLVYVHSHFYSAGISFLSVKQSTGIQNLDSTAYLSERCYLPSLAEQEAIATYLDTETVRIDALIAEKERLIETLHEFSRSIFLDALMAAASNGNVAHARIEWLPAIPPNWTFCKVKHIVETFDQGISPQCEARPPDEDEWGVLKVGCVNTGLFDPRESKALPPDLPTFDEITLREGDVMISRANTRNLVGRCAAADKSYPKLMLSDKLYRLRLDRQRCEPSFLVDLLALPAIRARIEERATGASASMLNIDRRTILELDIVLPPFDIQKRIVRQTQDKRQGIHKLVEHVSSEIALLREFRSTTISDAVLGRFRIA